MKGDLSIAESGWNALWDDAVGSKAWERWLVSGRLAAARADLDLAKGRIEDAQTWSMRAIDMAVASSRKKYEVDRVGPLSVELSWQRGLGQQAAGETPSGGGRSRGAPFAFHSLAGAGGIRRALAASGSDPSAPLNGGGRRSSVRSPTIFRRYMQRRFSPISVSPRYSKPLVEAGYAARDSPQILVGCSRNSLTSAATANLEGAPQVERWSLHNVQTSSGSGTWLQPPLKMTSETATGLPGGPCCPLLSTHVHLLARRGGATAC